MEKNFVSYKKAARSSALKDFPSFNENPALLGLVIPVRDKKITIATGESWSEAHSDFVPTIAAKITCDTEEFVKLYTTDLATYFELSITAFRLFGALLTAVQKHSIEKDTVFFPSDCESCKTFKITTTVYYRGITELLQKGFIYRTPYPNIYFINPSLFFNGDRIRFIREYIRNSTGSIDPELAPRFIAKQTARKSRKKLSSGQQQSLPFESEPTEQLKEVLAEKISSIVDHDVPPEKIKFAKSETQEEYYADIRKRLAEANNGCVERHDLIEVD